MFSPKTTRIKELAKLFPERIKELESMLEKRTAVYIDFSNVFYWQGYLDWHIDMKRVEQLFRSFDTVQSLSLYTGTLEGDPTSEKMVEDFRSYGYNVITKPVKIMSLSINMEGIASDSSIRLQSFIRESLLAKLDLETVGFLNKKLVELNKKDVISITERKCNFDVEIGSQITTDIRENSIDNFILWSGDSDFFDPIEKIIKSGKDAIVFATSRRISRELKLSEVQKYDIKKIKEFICFPRDLDPGIKSKLGP